VLKPAFGIVKTLYGRRHRFRVFATPAKSLNVFKRFLACTDHDSTPDCAVWTATLAGRFAP
jgi:hypothetical protein